MPKELWQVICAWCDTVYEEKEMPPGQPGGVTHGICDRCWKVLEEQD